MDEKIKKEIKIKNIQDIIEENLRIQNQRENSAEPKEYQNLTEEEINVEHLDLRDPGHGTKFLKSVKGAKVF